jgi:GDSL-like Lipase/Acylhydrolase family
MIVRKLTLSFFVAMTIVLLGCAFLQIARAANISWASSNDPMLSQETRAVPSGPYPYLQDCTVASITIDGMTGPQTACATIGKSIALAVYNDNGYKLAVKYTFDSKFYKINNVGYHDYYFNPILIPGTNIVYVERYLNSQQRSLSVFKDVTTKLSRNQPTDHTEYTWSVDAPDFELKDENSEKLGVNANAHSQGGRWIVVEVMGRGLVRIDTNNLSAKVISRHAGVYGQGSNPVMNLAVTSDGHHIGLGGQNAGLYLFDTPDSCGDPVANAMFSSLPHPCPEKDYLSFVDSHVGSSGDITWPAYPKFNDDGGQFTFYYGNANEVNRPFVTLTAAGYTPTSQLDYLALGDSISSGEGDTDPDPITNKKYYRAWTDVEENQAQSTPREKCHLSTRSYPYRLAQFMDLALDSPKQWNGVACSGAGMGDVGGNNPDYLGQGKGGFSSTASAPRLQGYDYNSLQAIALNEMIPGRVQQIDFVRKYKPKVITLTVGANNIDFGGKLNDCVLRVDTCYSAQSEGKRDLAKEIKNQFPNLIKVYKDLYDASDGWAKIYVVGYPQFINENSTARCDPNVGNLNFQEKELIVRATTYMNDVIEAAAKAAGVKYIDIENAFMPDPSQDPTGHRLCDAGTRYVNGIALRGESELQESFHPNYLGQIRMTSRIKTTLNNQSLLDYDICANGEKNICPDSTIAAAPAIPSYFGAEETANVRSDVLQVARAEKNTDTEVKTEPHSLNPEEKAKKTLYSDPVDLGEATVNPDGSLDTTVNIPSSVPSGFHTLVISGQSYSGEPIKLTKVIEVQGSNPNDRDEDGIDDMHDPCMFIEPVGVDMDQDGIDDMCDPSIAPPPIPKDPYRIRAGDPSRTYAGQPEAASTLYLERNIYAANKTGITGDYDPDHDGWVIVATNQASTSTTNTTLAPPLTPYARFWLEDKTVTNSDGTTATTLPHIAFRTKEGGCIQYKPTTLAKVTEAEVHTTPATLRTFIQEATDTNTCRSEPSTADLDTNGQPDNTQPLYLARRGDSTITHPNPDGTTFHEDPTKLYLFRSTRAAEAQLGKSDYAPNDAGLLAAAPTNQSAISPTDYREKWSLLATSPASAYNPLFNNFTKLKIINNSPYVLTGTTSPFFTQCTAYKPQTTDTIRQTTQTTRQLQADWMTSLTLILQGGCDG